MARRPLPEAEGTRLVHLRADLRSEEARRWLQGVDVLYHLGFQLWSRAGTAAPMLSVNLEGTANVLAARPARVVFASSAAVYGAWPDNPLPLTERHPCRPNAECAYAGHKLAAEQLCADHGEVVVLRVCAVLGPHADVRVARSVAGYRLVVPAIRGATPALQFLHEDDAVDAFVLARRAAAGVYNVATADWLGAESVAAAAGGRVVGVPRRALLAGAELGRALRLVPFGADRAALLNGPLALDATAATEAFGWRPSWTSAEVLRGAAGGWRAGGGYSSQR